MFFLIVIYLPVINAQKFPDYSFKYFDAKSGLKGTEVLSIDEDKFGLIWLGTNNGIYKFDGYNYYTLNKNLQKDKQPPMGVYRDILKHSDGNMWIATDYSGVSNYNCQTEKFTHFKPNENSKSIADGATYLMREDEDKNIWFAHFFNGISIFNYQKKSFEFLKHNSKNKNSILSNEIYALCSNYKGGMWIGCKNTGLSYYNKLNKEFTHYTKENGSGLNTNNIYSITLDNAETLWIGTDKGILYKKKDNLKFTIFKHLTFKENYFFNAYFNPVNNLIYFTSSNGLHIINPRNNDLKIYRLYPKNKPSENTNRCTNLFFDRNNNLWIQFNQGFCMATILESKISKYNDLANIGESNRICFFETIKDENIYTITKKYLLEKKLNHNSTFNQYEIPELSIYNLIYGDVVIYNPGKHSPFLLININSRVLYLFNTKTKKLEKIINLHHNSSITEKKIYDAYADSKGNIWAIDKYLGIVRYNFNEKKWAVINPSSYKINTDFYYYPTKFIEDISGNIWAINPFYGILKFNYMNGSFKLQQFKHQANNPFSRSSQIFYALADDSNGNIVFAGNGNEIDYYVNNQNKFYHLKREGCFEDITTNIAFDNKGFLWCFNMQNIYKIKCNTYQFKNPIIDEFEYHSYNWKNGFEGNYFGNNFVFVTQKNEFYFDSKESLLTMKPNTWIKENKASETKILNFFINGKPIEYKEFKSFIDENTFSLKHNQNNVEFHFASNSLVNAQNNIFKYKLIPYDIEWRYTTVFSPKTTYNNLPPNTYQFIIHSANSDGYWSIKETVLNFKIKPLFYTSNWFKIICLILFLCLVYCFYLIRIKTIKKQEKVKSDYTIKISELESKALRSQMNPHFVFNSLNSIQNYIMKNDVESSNKYLSKFAKLTRLIFDHSQQQFITLKSELNALSTYVELEELRFANKFDFNIIIPSNIDTKTIEIPPLILQPFVENAIWHGIMHKDTEKGIITIEINDYEEYIAINIIDNGIGREKAKTYKNTESKDHKSSGMRLTKERLDILNLNNQLEITTNIIDLYNEKNEPLGTKIELKIPKN